MSRSTDNRVAKRAALAAWDQAVAAHRRFVINDTPGTGVSAAAASLRWFDLAAPGWMTADAGGANTGGIVGPGAVAEGL